MKKGFLFILAAILVGCMAVPTMGLAAEKVIVYSPHGEEILDDITDLFMEKTGIEVEYLYMGGGELADRLRAEKGNPQADIIYGNPTNVFEQLKNESILKKSEPAWAAELADTFVDSDGYYYGTIQTPVVLFYNETLLTEEEAPKDWKDLADRRFEGQILLRSTTSAASRATFASIIDQYYQAGTLESEGWDFLRALDKNVKAYVTDSTLMFQEIAKGEAQLGFWTMDGISTNVRDNGMPLTIVAPESGAVIISDCVAMVEGGPNEDNAKAFMDFVGSEEVQLMLAESWHRIPTLPSALEKAPEWMRDLDFSAMDVSWANITEMQADWLQFFNDEIADANK